ncbi:MAG TPA: hypothetical protein VII73_11875 [Caulobacteraceae bacterium]
MSETVVAPPPPPAPPPPAAAVSDERQLALVIYILYLVPFAFGVTHIVGLVLAYVNRETAPDWLKSHFDFQVRTFWIGLLYFVVACISCLLLVGFVLVPVVIVWFIIRCALGINYLMKNQPYPTPQSWTI